MSKEYLEALENIKSLLKDDWVDSYWKTDYETIKQALQKAQEQEKVLEIIARKGLSLAERDMIKQSENYQQYCIKYSWCNMKNVGRQKTEEEFDTLKRWLG